MKTLKQEVAFLKRKIKDLETIEITKKCKLHDMPSGIAGWFSPRPNTCRRCGHIGGGAIGSAWD